MTRKFAATACLTLTLALSGCGVFGGDPFDYPDGRRIRAVVDQLFGDLERADYTAAASHWCATAAPPTAGELQHDFEGHPRPWKTKLVSSQHTPGGTGFVNLTLTDGAGTGHPYNVDFTTEGGTFKACDVSTGNVQIDVEI